MTIDKWQVATVEEAEKEIEIEIEIENNLKVNRFEGANSPRNIKKNT